MDETLFMIHGMMAGPWCWENYREYFSGQGYRCITPTLRFHDMNPAAIPDPRLGTTGLLDYVGDLEEEIGGLPEPPILMGHSMGGLLAQILAAKGHARAAVLLTPAPPASIHGLEFSVLKSFSGIMTRWGFWRKPFRLSFNKAVFATMHLLPPADRKKVYEKLVYESGRAACQIGFWFLDRTRSSRVDHHKVDCPVLVVSGKHDRITPAKVVRKTARRYRTATYKRFDGHAHFVLLEPGWREVAEFVAGWLKSHGL